LAEFFQAFLSCAYWAGHCITQHPSSSTRKLDLVSSTCFVNLLSTNSPEPPSLHDLAIPSYRESDIPTYQLIPFQVQKRESGKQNVVRNILKQSGVAHHTADPFHLLANIQIEEPGKENCADCEAKAGICGEI
jgi:hypothetical protein